MLAALLCAALCTLSQDPAVLLVRVLDVSDARMGGDAILVTDSAAGRARHVLIDASDRGRTVVARLAAFRVDTLALVILSHPHADHYGGLSAVLRRFPVRRFVYGGTPRTAVNYRALLHQIDSLRIPVVTADTGMRSPTPADSLGDVPEPAVALVLNRFGETAGDTAGDDATSRPIAG